MNKIPSKMIEVAGMSGAGYVPLDELILAPEGLPIALWGDTTKAHIEEAITFLKENGGGSIKIPANEQYNLLIIRVMWGRDRQSNDSQMLVRYEYNDWRPPHLVKDDDDNVVGEYRPYTGDPWKSGDIINNCDLANSDNKTTQWYCIASGVEDNPAGTWRYVSANIEPEGEQRFDYDEDSKTLSFIH